MLLCDACDRGYHIYCLKPRLYEVPAEDWFCPPCSRSSRLRHRAKALEAEVEAEARQGRGLQEGAHLLTRQTRGGGGGGGAVKRGRSQRECERELAELDAKLDDVRDARPRRCAASKAMVGARYADYVDEEDDKDEEDEAGDLKGGRRGRTR
jgi:hypothetical protein